MRPRRRPVLADGRRSQGYTPVENEILDSDISGAALALFLRIRRDCWVRKTDGQIESRALSALAVYHGLNGRELGKLLAELEEAKLIEVTPEGVRDVNFLTHSLSVEERDAKREAATERKRLERQRRMSQRDSQRESYVTSLSESQTKEEGRRKKEEGRPEPAAPSAQAREVAAEVSERVGILDLECQKLLNRPTTGKERDVEFAWAGLKRNGQLVPIPEIVDKLAQEMGRATPEGGLPSSLTWANHAVLTLGRAPTTGLARVAPNESARLRELREWGDQVRAQEAQL